MLQYFRSVMQAKKEDGASAVEYGLLVAAIAALIVVIVFALGGLIRDVFTNTCKTISSNSTTTSDCKNK